jgi:anaerobic magnesium-protoporphyrin IX monomethyl ester cyclase
MKIALIAPPYPLEEAPSPPLGICYVAASFEGAGADVRIFDYIVRGFTPEKFKRELDAYKPDVVGTNSVTMNFKAAAGILKIAKCHDPSIVTVMGGPHVSFDYENTLNTYPEIDLIVVGEGEETLKELIPVLGDKATWPDIKGLAFMDNGELVTTGKRDFIRDLDTLPLPARHLLPVSRYQAMGFPVSIITSRGCPNRCIFCQGRRMVGMKVRYRSYFSVVDEIEDILSYGFTRINIADDFFTSNKKRVRLICDEILNRKLSFSWAAFARVDSVSREVLELMKQAGCDTVSFGIESGNPEMLKRVRKGITLDQARNAVAMCRETGMGVFLSFMVGLPGETVHSLRDTRAFAEELDVPFGYHFLAPLPGTTLWEDIDTYDVELLTDDWNRFDANQAITRTSALTETEINAFVAVFEKEVTKHWEEMIARCEKGECSELDRIRVVGDRRMRLIFKLLTEDLLETCGELPSGTSQNGHLSQLVEHLTRFLGNPVEEIETIISDLAGKGLIKFAREGDSIRWYWTHSKDVDRLEISG